MEENNLTMISEVNTIDLQNIQNQNRTISQTKEFNRNEISCAKCQQLTERTWSETCYHWYTYGKITKDVYELSKVVSPAETVRRVVKYSINPVTEMLDDYTGFKDKKITVRGYEVPCSFSTFGKLFTEGLAFTVNPAQWGTYTMLNLAGRYFAVKAIEKTKVKSREAQAAILIGSSVILQQTWGKLEKAEKVQSIYETCQKPLKGVNETVNKITELTVDKIINKTFEKIGIDPKTPLGLTTADIQRKNNLIAAENDLADAKEKLELLTKLENDLKNLLADAQKNKNDLEVEKAKRDAIDVKSRIKLAREYVKNCSVEKDKVNLVSAKMISEVLPEIFKTENNLSDQDAECFADQLLKELKHAKGEKEFNKILERKTKKYKVRLQEQSVVKLDEANRKITEIQQSLDDARRARAKTEQREIVVSEKEYAKAIEEFKKNTNSWQQKEYDKEKRKRESTKNIDNIPLSGNIQYEISLSEFEKMVNDYIKDNKLYRINFNDNINKVFLDLKGENRVKISHLEGNNLHITVPIVVDNKRNVYYGVKGKVSKIRTDVSFILQLQESNPDKLLNANVMHSAFSIENLVSFKVLSFFPKINVQDTAYNEISKKFPEALMRVKNTLENALGKENTVNFINKNIPRGTGINASTIGIKPRIKDGNAVFDIDVNADFQCQIAAEALQNEFKPFTFNVEFLGLPFGDYSVDKLENINLSSGRIKADLSISGPIAGTLTASFKTQFINNEQRFIVDGLQFDDISTNSKLIQTINAWPRALQNCLPLHNKIEETLNCILRDTRTSIISHLQEQTPGNLVLDKDSANVTHILLDNNSMTVKGTLSSDNYVTDSKSSKQNRSGFSYSNRINLNPMQEPIQHNFSAALISNNNMDM